MEKLLLSNKTFLERYVSGFSQKQRWILALTAAGVSAVVSFLVLPVMLACPAASLPLIGHFFAPAAGAIAALSTGNAGLLASLVYLASSKKKALQGGSSIEKLARAVGGIVFLPLYAEAVDYLSRQPGNKESVKRFVRKKIIEWGYTESYAGSQTDTYLCKSLSSIKSEYKQKIDTLKQSKKYEGCSNKEIPYDVIETFAANMVKEFQQGC